MFRHHIQTRGKYKKLPYNRVLFYRHNCFNLLPLLQLPVEFAVAVAVEFAQIIYTKDESPQQELLEAPQRKSCD